MTGNQNQNKAPSRNRPQKKKRKIQAPRINIQPETTKRIIIFTISTLILATAQCSFFSTLKICPRTPDLILGLILAVALCDNPKSAIALSVGAGFFIDAIGGGAFALSPIIYFIYASIIGYVSQKFLKTFPSFVILLLPSLLYRALMTTLLALLHTGGSLGGGFALTLLLEALCTLLLCLPLYPIINLATKPLSQHSTFTFE